MQNATPEIEKLLELIDGKKEMAAMLAPSFPIDFSYLEIVGMLKRLGFKHVVEVARGAAETNRQLNALMKLHPDRRYIASPCPSIVRLIRNSYPQLVQYLAPIDSPMIAIAKIVAEKYPDCKKVYIGPCFVKKLEAKEDHPELDILVLTYRELADVFSEKNIVPEEGDKSSSFDIVGEETRLYPVSGGLSQSSGLAQKLTDPEYDVISGPELTKKVLDEFPHKPDLKLLDILFCDAGCISGAGIMSRDSLDERRRKVVGYWERG